jgi:hypothetical protein
MEKTLFLQVRKRQVIIVGIKEGFVRFGKNAIDMIKWP